MNTDCLASTGVTDFPLLLLVGVALLVVGAIVVVAFRRRSALILLALLPLAIGGLVVTQTPAPSFAACDTTPTAIVAATPEPTETPALIVVTTATPTAAPTYCGLVPTVTLPETEGITYVAVTSGTTVTVTATANPGYVIDPDAIVSWTFAECIIPATGG